MDSSLVRRLRDLDTSAVSDALDRLKLPGAVVGLTALSGPRRIAGRAITVQLEPSHGRTTKHHLCTTAVDSGGPGQIIVIAHNGCVDVAGWGGILSLGAAHRGIEGVVIDGACRDVDESRDLNLPVYGRNAVPVTARSRIIETAWNVPVKIVGCMVEPNDLVIADGSGVVFVPNSRAVEVIDVAERITAREGVMMAAAREGKPLAEVMAGNYESMLIATVREASLP
jgi:4-hydroxy-4-methyl-2-oxoglutarate aldolase